MSRQKARIEEVKIYSRFQTIISLYKMGAKTKAIVLMSGGLDSMLAAKLLLAQGIEVTGVCFESNFYGCARAKKAAEQIGIELKVVDISKEMLELVKNPPSGYGKHLNPCLDCHALMARMAGGLTSPQSSSLNEFGTGSSQGEGAVGYDVIATGEVLGQRPFSQTRPSLQRVEKLAGREILRPLSAKLLPETEAEKNGLVNRGKLLDIRGRNRERQMELAKKFKIKEYPNPAGGCLLTDEIFCERLMKMLDYWPECTPCDVELLRWGRVLWLRTRISADSDADSNADKRGYLKCPLRAF